MDEFGYISEEEEAERAEFEAWFLPRERAITALSKRAVAATAWRAARAHSWISVEDRLPESKPGMWSDPVIALADNGEIFELSCMSTYWNRSSAFIDSGAEKVIAWMPFPRRIEVSAE